MGIISNLAGISARRQFRMARLGWRFDDAAWEEILKELKCSAVDEGRYRAFLEGSFEWGLNQNPDTSKNKEDLLKESIKEMSSMLLKMRKLSKQLFGTSD